MNLKSFSNSCLALSLLLTLTSRSHALSVVDPADLVKSVLRAGTVENFLHALPLDLRSDYVLGHRPLGSHVGTALLPRGLLFGRDVIVSFGACPGSEGHDHVEMMDLRRLRPELIDVNLERGNFEVRRNPVSCQHCHGTMNRPLWPTNAIPPGWPGFYGAAVSKLTAAREIAMLDEFKATAGRHPRYSALADLSKLEVYGARGKVLYESNKRFEEVIARAVARNAFGYLKRHPNYARARIPLLVALNIFNDPAIIDHAPLLAPFVGLPEEFVREALARHELKVKAAIERHTHFKWQFLEHSLAMKFSAEDRAGYGHFRSERLIQLGTLISWLGEIYGLSQLEAYLSTSRQPGTFAFPGHLVNVSGPSQLERILFRDALAETPLTEIDVGRDVWTSPRELTAGLARLASALGVALPCSFYLQN